LLENTRDLTQDIELRTDIDDQGRIFVEIYNEKTYDFLGLYHASIKNSFESSTIFLAELLFRP
jgi:hypothetical protein